MTEAGVVAGYLVLSIILSFGALSILSHNRNLSRYTLWHLVAWAQFYQWIPLINSKAPSMYLEFFSDYNKSLKVYPLITFSFYNTITSRYQELGIEHSYFVNNTEKPLILIVASILIYLVMLCMKCECLQDFRKEVVDSIILRSGLICFFEFSIFSLLQIRYFEITTWYGIMNSVVAVAIIACVLVMLIYFPINSNFRIKENNKEDLERISTLIEELRYEYPKCRLYYVFFMLQRILAAVSYTVLDEYPGLQALLAGIGPALTSKAYLVGYVVVTKPFVKKSVNYFVIVLELLSALSIIFTAVFSLNGVSTSSKNTLALISIIFFWFGIGISVIKFSYDICMPANTSEYIQRANNQIHVEVNTGVLDQTGNMKRNRLGSLSTDPESPKKIGKKSEKIEKNSERIEKKTERIEKNSGRFEKKSEKRNSVVTANKEVSENSSEIFSEKDIDSSLELDYGTGIKFYGPLAKKYLSKK